MAHFVLVLNKLRNKFNVETKRLFHALTDLLH